MRTGNTYERCVSFANGVCIYILKQNSIARQVLAVHGTPIEDYPNLFSNTEADFIFNRLAEKYADVDPSMLREIAEP